MQRVRYINKARMHDKVKDLLADIALNLDGMLRGNAEEIPWTYNEEFINRASILMDKLITQLCELTLERATQRCNNTREFTVIKQDVLDAFDMYRASNK